MAEIDDLLALYSRPETPRVSGTPFAEYSPPTHAEMTLADKIKSVLGYEPRQIDRSVTPEQKTGLGSALKATGMDALTLANFVGPAAQKAALPMDIASRMARAKEMGFNTDKVWHHGTNNEPFEIFDMGRDGSGSGLKTGAAWLTDAVGSARDFGEEHLISALLRLRNPKVMESPPWTRATIPEYVADAKAAGHDGLIVNNVRDGAYTTNLAAVFDPKNIRHVDAAFDPAKSDSPNIFASHLAPAIVGSAAIAPSLADFLSRYGKGSQ